MSKMNKKHCEGCRNNFYNNRPEGDCWSLGGATLVKRYSVGMWENPPYKGKKLITVPDCWHGEGSQRQIMVKPEALTKEGFWKH